MPCNALAALRPRPQSLFMNSTWGPACGKLETRRSSRMAFQAQDIFAPHRGNLHCSRHTNTPPFPSMLKGVLHASQQPTPARASCRRAWSILALQLQRWAGQRGAEPGGCIGRARDHDCAAHVAVQPMHQPAPKFVRAAVTRR